MAHLTLVVDTKLQRIDEKRDITWGISGATFVPQMRRKGIGTLHRATR
jgi:hypothetical protein